MKLWTVWRTKVLKKWASDIEVDEVSGDHTAVIYYVAGHVGRFISRQRNYIDSKELLIDTEHIPGWRAKSLLVLLANRVM